jgi:hypothetical protein
MHWAKMRMHGLRPTKSVRDEILGMSGPVSKIFERFLLPPLAEADTIWPKAYSVGFFLKGLLDVGIISRSPRKTWKSSHPALPRA